MADTAAHLVDRVLPWVPVRQWVLSVPRPVRYLMARDPQLLKGARRIFISELFRDLRRRAGIRGAGCGAVTAVQRFGSALNLNVHFHTLALDGVYVPGEERRFRRIDPPTRDELDRMLGRVRFRVMKLLDRRGYLHGFGEEGGGIVDEAPTLFDAVQAASIQERKTVDGRPVGMIGAETRPYGSPDEKPYCVVSGDGWSLQAGVRIRSGDRAGLEKLCGYILRPALAVERLEELRDGRIAYGFRKARYDGATHVVLTPLQLVEKVAALVAPPRAHLVNYDGVLAPHARRRGEITRTAGETPEGCRRHPEEGRPTKLRKGRRGALTSPRASRSEWADLMARWLGVDVMICPKCGTRMKMLALIRNRSLAGKMLKAMGLPSEAPAVARSRPPPGDGFESDQGRFDFD